MSASEPLALSFLTPHPRPASDFAAPGTSTYANLSSQLVQEAHALLQHKAWPTHQKEWHSGLVSTSSLPAHAVALAPPPAPPDATAEDPSLGPVKSQGKKGGFFGGGSGKGHAKEKPPTLEGLAFHQRTTVLDPSAGGLAEGVTFDKLWDALAVNHCQQEAEYVHNLSKVVSLDGEHGHADTFLKLYELPFPTQNRCFLSRVVVVDTTPRGTDSLRSFLVFSLPVHAPPRPEEKGFCRGRYVGVEQVEELDGGKILWRCASMSSPGGSLPHKLSETYMASSMASAVEPFLKWLKKKPASERRTRVQQEPTEERERSSTAATDASSSTKVGSDDGIFDGLEHSMKTMNLAQRRAVAEVIAQ